MIKIKFLTRKIWVCIKIKFCKHNFSPLNTGTRKKRIREAQKLPDLDPEHYCSIKLCLVKHLFLAFGWYRYCSKTCLSCI
jgi:hypothetical protein